MSTAPSFSPYFKSERIARIFSYLLKKQVAVARELANLIDTESRQIYPRLKRYIAKGWVVTQKINNMNRYSLTKEAKKLLSTKAASFDDVLRKAEALLGRKLDQDEVELLRFFHENGYIERTSSESIAEVIYHKLQGKISLGRIEEILNEFTAASVLFAFRLRSGIVLKVRLNKKLLE